MMNPVQTFQDTDIPERHVWGMMRLFDRVWPGDRSLEKSVAGFLAYAPKRPASLKNERYLVIVDDQVVGHTQTFLRVMNTPQGKQAVMALSGVCTDPRFRGHGFGAAMVRQAFARVDAGLFPVCVFQTPVERFYAKLGAAVCPNNDWVNRTHSEDPNIYPWEAGEKLMFYPHDFPWPEGLIDINGFAY